MGFFPPGTYDLFLTHRWQYTDEWQGLVALIDDYIPGRWRNWSLPWHDTSIDRYSDDGRVQLEHLLDGHISMASTVLVLPGTIDRAEGRMWMDRELSIAEKHSKAVIGVRSQGDTPFPDELIRHVHAIVERDARRIIKTVDQVFGKRAGSSVAQ